MKNFCYNISMIIINNKNSGFSLTDLVVTLVVVAIIAIVAIPIYRGYVKRGIAAEGNALLGEINAAQQIYYTRHGQYFDGTAAVNFDRSLGVSTKRAKYFKSWSVHASGDSFTATTSSTEGHVMTLTGSASGDNNISDSTDYN